MNMNMNAKKRVNGSWVDAPYYIHKTAADTFTTLPVDVYADGNNATVGLKGNTVQNGTPTPENPVEVQAVGDRTANLFDKSVASINAYPAANGTISSNPNTRTTYCVCKPNTTYTISKIASKRFIVAYIKTMPAIGENYYGNISDIEATEITITTGADALFLIVFYYHASYDTLTESEIKNSIMVVEGSTSLPYEPYGYKIPVVTSADGTEPITTPIYLPTPLYSGDVLRSDGTITRSDGTTETGGSAEISEYIPISGDTSYTFNGIGSYNSPCYGLYDENKQLIGAYRYNGASIIKFTSPNNARYFRFTHIKRATQAMMVEGAYTTSTMLDYEPYGIKIPILSANTTTHVYLGEVETTRRVRKLVLTGKETWYLYSANNVHQFYTQGMVIGGVANSAAYSTITPYGMTANNRNGDYGCYTVISGNEIAFQMYGSRVDIPTQTEWKSYLAAQYAAGTPVTVWYALANEETGIVNEPLMKIGNYADEVSNISIPTITGKNIVDVETVLKPSEVSFNYAGWHTAVVHKRINGAWD